jgi:hypothetical protein
VPDEQETLKQQIIMRQVMRVGEVTARQSSDLPDDHAWNELDSLITDIEYALLALWGYETMEQLMGPDERKRHHEMKTREAAEWMIEQGYLERSWDNGEEIWTITEKGKDYYSQLQEHVEEE